MRVEDYRSVWAEKKVLQHIYADFQRRIAERCVPGRTLEIGGGAGNLVDAGADVVSTDIQWAPWLDVVADAQRLPFEDGSFANIVMVDVLHHIECPVMFLNEARRVLRPGGRMVFLEPAMTPVARIFYDRFHEEPVIMDADPLADCMISPDRDPYDSNQAIPSLLFGRYRGVFTDRFPDLKLVEHAYLSLFAYPLSGGFKPWSLIPSWMVRPVLAIESLLMPVLGPLMAFRGLFVVERGAPDSRERSG